MTREELIAEVLRLDTERTQGEWSGGFNGTCYQVDAEMHAVCTTQFCYAPESKQNTAFIAHAPDMARIIADQKAEIAAKTAFIEELTRLGGKYPEVNGTQIVVDAYRTLDQSNGDWFGEKHP